MLIRSHTRNSLHKLHVVCFLFCFCIVRGSLNLDVVSLVIRLIVFFAAICCIHVYWVTHDSGISPFWFALYKLHNFLVNMSFVYLLVFAIKMVLIDLINVALFLYPVLGLGLSECKQWQSTALCMTAYSTYIVHICLPACLNIYIHLHAYVHIDSH